MKILENIKVPTGNILIVQGDYGKLECLSLGDYGKEQNVKADFMGLTKEINGVPHGNLMPLEKKWVITISSQYGCSMGCTFCDVPRVGPGINATTNDMIDQVLSVIKLHPGVKSTERLNIHFARMGEPTWNKESVIEAATELFYGLDRDGYYSMKVHPVVSTMMPSHNPRLESFLYAWLEDVKNKTYRGNAGLQLSINSTNEKERKLMFNNNAHTLGAIARIMVNVPQPRGRKIALNFALAGYEIDAEKLIELFDPRYFMCKITPMHMTNACIKNNIKTDGGYEHYYPYKDVEEQLKKVGFDVIVFVPSYEEDLGRITCGNAILSGSRPEIKGFKPIFEKRLIETEVAICPKCGTIMEKQTNPDVLTMLTYMCDCGYKY